MKVVSNRTCRLKCQQFRAIHKNNESHSVNIPLTKIQLRYAELIVFLKKTFYKHLLLILFNVSVGDTIDRFLLSLK